MSHQRNLQIKFRILDLCSTYDFQTTWKQLRKIGHSSLFSQCSDYQDWKVLPTSSTLIYRGKLGAGKSVLLANIVDDLSTWIYQKNTPVAYFFCRYDIPESLEARTIFGSLARQLLLTISDLTLSKELPAEITSYLDIEDICSLLQHIFPGNTSAYIVLDGFDECDSTTRYLVVEQLQKLQRSMSLHLCISIRLDSAESESLSGKELATSKTVLIPDDNPDIEAYIDGELERLVSSEKLKMGNPVIILEIQKKLMERSQGMFLWVALQLRSLCAMKTDDDIRQALENLPKDLPETFTRILQRSGEQDKVYQRRILELVAAAFRTLTTEELREALSVVPGITDWKSSSLINDLISTLSCCGGLVTVDEEEQTVRLVHHSFKQFLLTEFKDANGGNFTMLLAHSRIAHTILTYLNYGIFGTQLSNTVIPHMNVGSAPSNIVREALGSSKARNIALKLLKSRKRADFDMSRTIIDASSRYDTLSVDHHFHDYAKSFCMQHIKCTSEQEPLWMKLLLRWLSKTVINVDTVHEYSWTPIIWAAENGHEAVVKLLLDTGKVDINGKNNSFGIPTPLSCAAKNGHEAVVKLLLDTGKANINGMTDSPGIGTPISWAAKNGHEAVVKLLLDTGKVDINGENESFGIRTPLSCAAENGHEAVVKLLLNTGKADVDTVDKDIASRTPLLWAAKNGHDAVVKLLLYTGKVEVDAKDKVSGQTPLSWAAEQGHIAVVKLLLNTGKVDINGKNENFGICTPLSCAAGNGHEAVVKLLLDTGKVDVDAKHHDIGRTSLSLAAENGHVAVIKLLLETNVDIEAKDSYGKTSLVFAAENGHEAVVKLLLKTGMFDINIKDEDLDSQTLLLWSVKNGHKAVVEMLLNTGKVEIEAKDSYGQTPLLWAAKNGHAAVFKLLLDTNKVDIEAKNRGGQTPLSWAAEGGHEAVVKLLLDTDKVDTNAKERYGQTPLWWAFKNGHAAVVKLLLDTDKVDIEAKNRNGQTPLSWAADGGHAAVVKLLLDKDKVGIEAKNRNGQTPLSCAASQGHAAVVKLLLDTSKVDVEAKDSYSKTPLGLAAENGHEGRGQPTARHGQG